MPVSILAAVAIAAPVIADCTICSWAVSSDVSASVMPVNAPATALFFCTKEDKKKTVSKLCS